MNDAFFINRVINISYIMSNNIFSMLVKPSSRHRVVYSRVCDYTYLYIIYENCQYFSLLKNLIKMIKKNSDSRVCVCVAPQQVDDDNIEFFA